MLHSNPILSKTLFCLLASAESTDQGRELACHPEVKREAFTYS